MGRRSKRGLAVGVAVLAVCAIPAAAGAALPSVGSGQAPGPPLLYGPEPQAPQLSTAAPFTAEPLLVSGTDAYRDGEYVYQDYLFDDRGADSVPGPGNRPGADDAGFSPTAGDVQYPTAPKYAGNVADLVELRIKPTATDIVYRVTLNSLVDPDTTVVGIGIDTNPGGVALPVTWPNGAGVSSPGLDHFITAWGTGGELRSPAGAAPTPLSGANGSVSVDTTTKQMTITVPRTLLDPGTSTWRYVAGTGLWDSAGNAWKTPGPGSSAGTDTPVSGGTQAAPGVFNLAFRFDEPQIKQPDPETPPIPYTTFPGTGNWFEDKQAYSLSRDTTTTDVLAGGDDFFADVDFGELAAGSDEFIHDPPATQARIMPSGLDLPQGVKVGFPQYGGKLQPYVLRVPPGTDPSNPSGLTFALPSLGGTYTQFSVFSPNQLTQLGDERSNLVATPLGHGPDGWYTDEAEVDVFEVWADIDRHFDLDPDRSYVSGYSMGGYGSYKLGVEYPDLWSRVFTVVGPPGEGIWVPPADPTAGPETLTADLLANVRWVPFLNWVGTSDELVPYIGPVTQQQRFDQLGLRSELWSFAGLDHFALAILDEWGPGRDFLGDATVQHDPGRVDYAFFPAADRPALGLVHDHAYWVSGLEARDANDPGDLGSLSARSLAFGEGNPQTAPVSGGGAIGSVPPAAYASTGTQWTAIPQIAPQNALDVELDNVAAGIVDGTRARLDGGRELRVSVTTDGPTILELELPIAAEMEVVRLGQGGAELPAPEVALGAGGADFDLDSSGTYLIRPPRTTSSNGPPAAAATCRGKQATLVGTDESDSLSGTPGDDVIVTGGGRDRVRARGGEDVICLQGGRDRVRGSAGEDILIGGAGTDRLAGGGGDDALRGGKGDDKLRGGSGEDSCRGGPGRDAEQSCSP